MFPFAARAAGRTATGVAAVSLSFAHASPLPAPEETRPIERYVQREDPDAGWTVRRTRDLGTVERVDILLRSQTWRGIPWTHQLTLLFPETAGDSRICLLLIAGGSNRDGEPRWHLEDDEETWIVSQVASACGIPVAVLAQVPNQPLYDGRKEDALIAYTFDRYLETSDPDWPLLFPMVKSAVRAMDAVQQYAAAREDLPDIEKFVVTGASKRGWTTWLTGAVDPRVAAIAPMVIDMLNLPRHLDYQREVWGDYSEQIADYSGLDLPRRLTEEGGRRLVGMVDPFSYRDSLALPKIIFIGTNDPYWPVDSVKWYIDRIPGPTLVHYVPNAGHGLGDKVQALRALTAFVAMVAGRIPLPKLEAPARLPAPDGDGRIRFTVEGDDRLQMGRLWTADSPTRDFRRSAWKSRDLPRGEDAQLAVAVSPPGNGFRAFYVDLVYPSPPGGSCTVSTRVYVLDSEGLVADEGVPPDS